MFCIIPSRLLIEPAARLTSADKEAASLLIEGLVCSACASRVRSRLERVDGVTSASVDLATGAARVEGDASRVTPEALIAAVDRAVLFRPLRRWIARVAS